MMDRPCIIHQPLLHTPFGQAAYFFFLSIIHHHTSHHHYKFYSYILILYFSTLPPPVVLDFTALNLLLNESSTNFYATHFLLPLHLQLFTPASPDLSSIHPPLHPSLPLVFYSTFSSNILFSSILTFLLLCLCRYCYSSLSCLSQ